MLKYMLVFGLCAALTKLQIRKVSATIYIGSYESLRRQIKMNTIDMLSKCSPCKRNNAPFQ